MGYGLAEGRRSELPLVAGVVLGDAVALTCSVAGLGAVLAASAQAFTILKYCGALYLIYLGIGLIRSGATPTPKLNIVSSRKKFLHALAVTSVNPKPILFRRLPAPVYQPRCPGRPAIAAPGRDLLPALGRKREPFQLPRRHGRQPHPEPALHAPLSLPAAASWSARAC